MKAFIKHYVCLDGAIYRGNQPDCRCPGRKRCRAESPDEGGRSFIQQNLKSGSCTWQNNGCRCGPGVLQVGANVLVQSSAAMVAQANQLTGIALTILNG